ncbi:hypothetical protein DENSPDRAFT_887088 [Dentipellis sp. KUC8613]|nr:hypothetical protein DENSPDRAFT_887088 [Dentipellis sp. KUC8613]
MSSSALDVRLSQLAASNSPEEIKQKFEAAFKNFNGLTEVPLTSLHTVLMTEWATPSVADALTSHFSNNMDVQDYVTADQVTELYINLYLQKQKPGLEDTAPKGSLITSASLPSRVQETADGLANLEVLYQMHKDASEERMNHLDCQLRDMIKTYNALLARERGLQNEVAELRKTATSIPKKCSRHTSLAQELHEHSEIQSKDYNSLLSRIHKLESAPVGGPTANDYDCLRSRLATLESAPGCDLTTGNLKSLQARVEMLEKSSTTCPLNNDHEALQARVETLESSPTFCSNSEYNVLLDRVSALESVPACRATTNNCQSLRAPVEKLAPAACSMNSDSEFLRSPAYITDDTHSVPSNLSPAKWLMRDMLMILPPPNLADDPLPIA